MYELTLWGNYTHWNPGVGMTTALILCVFHDDRTHDSFPDTWPDNKIPNRFDHGSATIVYSDTPPSCKYCLEVAKQFDEQYEKDNADYYGENNLPY